MGGQRLYQPVADQPTLPDSCKCEQSINQNGTCWKCGRDLVVERRSDSDDTAAYMALAAAVGPPFVPVQRQPTGRAAQRQARVDAVKRLRAAGMKDAHIAEEIGITHQALYQWLRVHGDLVGS